MVMTDLESGGQPSVWLGGGDSKVEGRFVWGYSETDFNFANWNPEGKSSYFYQCYVLHVLAYFSIIKYIIIIIFIIIIIYIGYYLCCSFL